MRAYTSQIAVGLILVAILGVFVWYVRVGHDSAGARTELYVMGDSEHTLTEGVYLTYAIRNRMGSDYTYGVRADISLTTNEYTTVSARDVFVRDGEVRVIRDVFPSHATATSTIRIAIPDLRQFIHVTIPPPR